MSITSLFPAFIIIAVVLTVLFTELIKRLDKKDVLKGYRVYVPLVLSFGAAGLLRIGNFFAPEQMWFWWAAIFGFSVFAFEAILKKVSDALNSHE
jgi:cyanate permease